MWQSNKDYFEHSAPTLSEEWQHARLGRITGHSMLTVPTDIDKFLTKTTYDRNAFGIAEESEALQQYIYKKRLTRYRQPGFIIPNPHSDKYSWVPPHLKKALCHIGGTPDVVVGGLSLVAELKCKQPNSKHITHIYPSHYTQLMVNTGLMGYTQGDYFVVQPDQSIYMRRFQLDPTWYQNTLIPILEFANDHLRPAVARETFELPLEIAEWYWSE